MSVGEFTVSNIHMDEDKREEQNKKSTIDMAKLQADISAQKDLAKQVCAVPKNCKPPGFSVMNPDRDKTLLIYAGKATRGTRGSFEPGKDQQASRRDYCNKGMLYCSVRSMLRGQAVEAA